MGSSQYPQSSGGGGGGGGITDIVGDVSASGSGVVASTVNSVGGSSSADVHTAEQLINAAKSGNKVLASPSDGSSAAPAFRALVPADIPNISESQVTNLTSDLALKAPLASPTFTGTVTAPTFSGALSGNATTATTATNLSGNIPESQVTNLTSDLALKAPIASPTFTGTVTGTFSGPLTGNVTGNASGSAGSFTGSLSGDVSGTQGATVIGANSVTNSKLAQMAANTFKGNNTGATANALDLTATQLTAELNAVVGDSGAGGTKGLVPAPASGDAALGRYLKADGTWTTPTISSNVSVDLFSGTGAQTVYTLSADPGSKNNTNVFISGVYQQKSTYSLSTTTLTFSTAPPSGTNNIEVEYGSALTIGTPSDGTVTAVKLNSGAAASGLVPTSDGVGGVTYQAPLSQNYIINGGFDFWQRIGTTSSLTLANSASTPYVCDRWMVKNNTGTNGVVTVSRVPGVTAGSKYGHSVQITTAPTASQANVVETYHWLSNAESVALYNQNISFSIMVKALGNITAVKIRLVYSTTEASGFNALTSLTAFNVNSSSFTKCTLNNVSVGTAIGLSGIIGIQIIQFTASTGNLYDLNNGYVLEQAMINIGSIVAPFRRAGSYTEELAMCQRFYWKTFDPDVTPAIGASINGYVGYSAANAGAIPYSVNVGYPVTMRALPTITFYGGLSSNWYDTFSGASSGTSSVNFKGLSRATFLNGQVAGDAAGHPIGIHATFEAEIF